MPKNPSLYEINTRVWIEQFDTADHEASLADIPESYWHELKDQGMDFVWLMGIWKVCKTTAKFSKTENDLNFYKSILPDFEDLDVLPSPFAIDDYELDPSLGTYNDLKHLKYKLNQVGLGLILDFIPNHFSRDSHLVDSHPEYFIQGTKSDLNDRPGDFFKKGDTVFAHGKDPHFPAWIDTVQINYFNPSTRDFMLNKMIEISNLCDGIRCDMSMLVLNQVFEETWANWREKNIFINPGSDFESEFWYMAIQSIKKINSDFLTIAEVYWGMEYQMHQLGFDFSYDKKLYDLLASEDKIELHNYLGGDKSYQSKMVRFIENHDEDRSIEVFGTTKVMSAAVAISTLPGLHFYQDGQWFGHRVHLPVQLGRNTKEHLNQKIYNFYSRLLEIAEDPVLKNGDWSMLKLESAEGDFSFENLIAWQWKLGQSYFFIFINYSQFESVAMAKLNILTSKISLNFIDVLNRKTYIRLKSELDQQGLFVKLDPYQSHIFRVEG